jgi:hypothetical protein
MPTSLIDSVVFRDIFGTEPMRSVWSDGNRTQRYFDISKPRSRGPMRCSHKLLAAVYSVAQADAG